MLAVDIQALGFPNSAVLLATYSNTSSDLDASGPVPYWARKRIQLNCPPGIFRLRFRRLDMTHGSPYLYLDEFAVEH